MKDWGKNRTSGRTIFPKSIYKVSVIQQFSPDLFVCVKRVNGPPSCWCTVSTLQKAPSASRINIPKKHTKEVALCNKLQTTPQGTGDENAAQFWVVPRLRYLCIPFIL